MNANAPITGTVTRTWLLEGLRTSSNGSVWALFVDRYRPMLVAFACRLGLPSDAAEDAAQQALAEFVRAYQGGRYNRDAGRLRDWLFGIARNQVRSMHRGRARDARVGEAGVYGGDADRLAAPDVWESLWQEEWQAAVLRECLERVRREVEPVTVAAFTMFAVQGRPARDVGAELGLSENAVFGAKRRVLRRILELMPAVEEDL
jgi:RNA polymerase sigma-70 factor, ECF subfamily